MATTFLSTGFYQHQSHLSQAEAVDAAATTVKDTARAVHSHLPVSVSPPDVATSIFIILGENYINTTVWLSTYNRSDLVGPQANSSGICGISYRCPSVSG